MKYIVDIKCDIEGDYDIVGKYEERCVVNRMGDLIYRQAAIDALWKALYEYEDKTEKQFIDSEELDVADWIQHRNFVQNMSDIDRQTILGLPSAEPERKKGKWLLIDAGYYDYVKCSQCGETLVWGKNFCPNCGADMREGEVE